jgi:hypothetical protein
MNVYLWIQADDVEDSKVSESFMRRVCVRLGANVLGVVHCYPAEDAITSYTATCAVAEKQHAFILSSNRPLELRAFHGRVESLMVPHGSRRGNATLGMEAI